MDTPTYTADIIVGGADQTTYFDALPAPTGSANDGIITKQSGELVLTFYKADGTTPFDLSSVPTPDAKVIPFNSDVVEVTLDTGAVSGAGNNVYTVSWVREKIPASWSQFAQDRFGAIVLFIELQETGTADYFQVYTRFNVFDGDFRGDQSTTPIEFRYDWIDAIVSEWAKYNRGTPTSLTDALAYLSGAGKNDWGTVTNQTEVTSPVGVDNAQYIIAGIGGDWSTFTIGDIVRYSATDSVWYNVTPADGYLVYDLDTTSQFIYKSAAWTTNEVTHTGQVTGSTVLTLDATAITDQSTVTAATGDLILVSRAGVLQNVDASDLSGDMNTAIYDPSAIGEQLIGATATQSMTNKTVNGVTLATGGASTQYLSADGNYSTPAGAGDMATAIYDPSAVSEQLVGLTAIQSVTNKTVNGVTLNSSGLPNVFLNATGGYSTPVGIGDMNTLTYDPATVNEQLVGLTASQNMINKSVNGVTLATGGASTQFLSADGTYITPAGAGDMLKAAYDVANVNEQLTGLTATQALTNKTVNGVILDSAGSASLFLTQAGTYVTPAGGGDMVESTYDPAAISEQLVGLTATQSLTNKDVNGVTLDGSGSSVLFLNQSGGYSTPSTTVDEQAIAAGTDNNQTGTAYTLVLSDADNATIWMSNAALNTLTIPPNSSVAFLVGTKINVMMEGVGTTVITADTGVTLNGVSTGNGNINNQYQGVTLTKRGTDTWIVTGDIGTIV